MPIDMGLIKYTDDDDLYTAFHLLFMIMDTERYKKQAKRKHSNIKTAWYEREWLEMRDET